MSSSVSGGMMRHQNVGAAAGNAGVDGLTNPRFEFGQITWQIENNFALFPIQRVQLHAQFYAAAIRFSAAVASHAAHRGILCAIPCEVEESRDEMLKASRIDRSGWRSAQDEDKRCLAAIATSLSPRPEQFITII